MKRRTFCALLPAAGALLQANAAGQNRPRERQLFDHDWRFFLGDASGAEAPDFATSGWRTLDLPHDWSIEGAIDPKSPAGGSGGFFPVGVGWYRRTFTLPAAWRGRRVSVEFEGIHMNATVYLNGRDLGMHPYGYTSFFHDLTPHLQSGENVLAIRVDNSRQRNSRWYSGSGIYRHVWLQASEAVRVAQWGTCITTSEVSEARATVAVKTRIVNESNAAHEVELQTMLYASSGPAAGHSASKARVEAGGSAEISQEIPISKPELWSLDSPNLYRALSRVTLGGKLFDEVATPFGIRSIEWSAGKGFVLNGQTVKMTGGCIHHENGPLGAVAFDRAEERRIQLLKQAGFNAIRSAHNPPSAALLDACDRLGMLVMDEAFDCWSKGKNPFDYNVAFPDWWQRDVDSWVMRDRNHPSVVMWNIGNEIPERGDPLGAEEAQKIADYVRGLDRTRPITSALNLVPKWTNTDAFYATLDVGGYNYNLDHHVEDHQRVPSRLIACTESYPQATFDYWEMVNDFPYIVGDFVWTAIDYLGESGLGRWYYRDPGDNSREAYGAPFPCHGADCGDIDLCGNRRANAHYRNIVWDRGEKLFLGVRQSPPEGKELRVTRWGVWPVYESWTWPGMEGRPLEVEIYSRAESVRLYFGENLVGEKPTTRAEKFKANFTLPYARGALKAVAMQAGRPIAESVLRTVGAPARVRLTPDRTALKADGQDISFVVVEAVDASGQPHPNADHPITFRLQGPGTIAAVGNADLKSEERYTSTQRKLFHGKALVVVRSSRSGGTLTLTAEAPGLQRAMMRLTARG